jgi:hypothetical protein
MAYVFIFLIYNYLNFRFILGNPYKIIKNWDFAVAFKDLKDFLGDKYQDDINTGNINKSVFKFYNLKYINQLNWQLNIYVYILQL